MAGVRPHVAFFFFLFFFHLLSSPLRFYRLISLLFLPALSPVTARFTCLLLHRTITPKALTPLSLSPGLSPSPTTAPSLIPVVDLTRGEVDSLDKSSPTRLFLSRTYPRKTI